MGDLTSVQRVEYENAVKHAFQSGGSELHKTVRVKDAPRAGTYKFRKFGTLDMIPRGDYKSALNLIAQSHETVDCIATNWVLPVGTDEFEQGQSGGEAPQEMDESMLACGFGMARKRDYSVVAALEAGTPELSAITAGSGLTIAKLREGLIQFDKYEMRSTSGAATGDSNLYCLITEVQHDELLADSLTQSIETSNFKSLVDGKMKDFVGYQFLMLGTGRGTNGLQETGGVRRCYAYVKSALGQAVCLNPRIKTGYEILMTTDVLVGQLSLGSVVVDSRGFIQFDCTE